MTTWKDRLNAQYGGAPVATQPVSSWKTRLNVTTVAQMKVKQEVEKRKRTEDTLIKAQKETEKYLQEYNDATSGFAGSVLKRFGIGVAPPTLVAGSPVISSPAYVQAQQYGQENITNLRKPITKNLKEAARDIFTENTTRSIYDVFYQDDEDRRNLDLIEKNTKTIIELNKRNKLETNPDFRQRRQVAIDTLIQQSKDAAEASGGKIKNKTTLQLIGQSVGTALELLPFPVGSGMTVAGRAVLNAGTKQALKALGKEGAFFGASFAASSKAQEKGATGKEIALSGVTGGIAGALLVMFPWATKAISKYGAEKVFGLLQRKISGKVTEELTPAGEKIIQEVITKPKEVATPEISPPTILTKEDLITPLEEPKIYTKSDIDKIPGKQTLPKEIPPAPKIPTEPSPNITVATKKTDALGNIVERDTSGEVVRITDKNGTVTFVNEIKPTFGAERGKTISKPYKKFNKALEEANIENGFGYKKETNIEQVNAAKKVVEGEADNAYRVAFKYKDEPGVLNSVTNIVMEKSAREAGNESLANMLKLNRLRQQTRNAKELQAENIALEGSANKYLRRLISDKMVRIIGKSESAIVNMLKFGKKSGKELLDTIIKEEATKIEKAIATKKLDMTNAQKIIDALIC